MLVATGIAVRRRRRAVPLGLLLPGLAGARTCEPCGRRGRCRHERPAAPSTDAARIDGRRITGRPSATRRRSAVLPAHGRRGRRLRDLPRAAASRSCSRGPRAAARPASSSTWPGVSAGRSSRSPATTISPPATSPAATSCAASETVWQDGPLTRAARHGALCYLDEIVEARQDTVVVHPSADRRPAHPADRQDGRAARGASRVPARRVLQPGLPARPQGPEAEHAPALRRARVRLSAARSSRRRSSSTRAASNADRAIALVTLTGRLRQLGDRGLAEVPSTRLLVAAARLIAGRHPARDGLSHGAARAAHRRSRPARGHPRSGDRDDVAGPGAGDHVRTGRSDPRRRALRTRVGERLAPLPVSEPTFCHSPVPAPARDYSSHPFREVHRDCAKRSRAHRSAGSPAGPAASPASRREPTACAFGHRRHVDAAGGPPETSMAVYLRSWR